MPRGLWQSLLSALRALYHGKELRLGAVTHGLGNSLAVLKEYHHRNAGDLKAHGELHLLVHIDLADLEGIGIFLGDLMQHGGEHFAGAAPVGVKVQQDGFVGVQHFGFKIQSSNVQFSHGEGSFLCCGLIIPRRPADLCDKVTLPQKRSDVQTASDLFVFSYLHSRFMAR